MSAFLHFLSSKGTRFFFLLADSFRINADFISVNHFDGDLSLRKRMDFFNFKTFNRSEIFFKNLFETKTFKECGT